MKLGIAKARLSVTQARCLAVSTDGEKGRKVPAPRVKWQLEDPA